MGRKPKQDKQGSKLKKVIKSVNGEKPLKEKKSKLSPKEQEVKAFKKEFTRQLNYFKFLKKCGNAASKEFKQAKLALKKGNDGPAKKAMAKYCLMDINAWVKATE